MRKNGLYKNCERCGAPFYVQAYRADTARFCSNACRPPMSAEERKARKKASDKIGYQKHKEKRNRYGAEYYAANKEIARERMKDWYERNAEKAKAASRKNRIENGDKVRADRRQHYRDNKARYVANARKREERVRRATPAWADLEAIVKFYEQAERMTQVTGIKHHVDHIYPLQSRTMCGLHVETNLQVIPAETNLRKSNAIDECEVPLCCAWPSAIIGVANRV